MADEQTPTVKAKKLQFMRAITWDKVVKTWKITMIILLVTAGIGIVRRYEQDKFQTVFTACEYSGGTTRLIKKKLLSTEAGMLYPICNYVTKINDDETIRTTEKVK